jgi:hypothetical protein
MHASINAARSKRKWPSSTTNSRSWRAATRSPGG